MSEEFQKSYREAIGLFATGVTVILAEKDGEVHGMTANAVTSVSLEPTLLLFCPAKDARISPFIEKGKPFTVNILAADQEEISNYYSGGDVEVERELIDWPAAKGVPRLGGALASFACEVYAMHDGGDHWIVCGEVLDMHREDDPGQPLLFYGGGYQRLAD